MENLNSSKNSKDLGDGIFFQFIMCISIWISGMIVHAVRDFPQIYAFSILAGVIQTFGNVLSVIIIKFIGVGLGNVYWNTISNQVND